MILFFNYKVNKIRDTRLSSVNLTIKAGGLFTFLSIVTLVGSHIYFSPRLSNFIDAGICTDKFIRYCRGYIGSITAEAMVDIPTAKPAQLRMEQNGALEFRVPRNLFSRPMRQFSVQQIIDTHKNELYRFQEQLQIKICIEKRLSLHRMARESVNKIPFKPSMYNQVISFALLEEIERTCLVAHFSEPPQSVEKLTPKIHDSIESVFYSPIHAELYSQAYGGKSIDGAKRAEYKELYIRLNAGKLVGSHSISISQLPYHPIFNGGKFTLTH